MPKRKDLPQKPEGSSTVDETIKLEKKHNTYLDKLCSHKVEHPKRRKMLTLAESIEYIGNGYRTWLNQLKYEPTKEQNDGFIKELRTVSNRLYELLIETIDADRSVNAPRTSNLGVSVTAISTLKECLTEIRIGFFSRNLRFARARQQQPSVNIVNS